MMMPNPQHRIAGLLLGTAVGDSLGLPAEGLSRKAIETLGWNRWRHRLLLRHGMISDDTEHTLFVAQALLATESDADRFERSLAWKLRLWLLGLPAGIGLATGRAIIKLWLGFPPRHSGVFSAGNGPAMRSAIIGARFATDHARLDEFVLRSTRITHTDPKAYTGAMAVALGAAFAVRGGGREQFPELFLQWQAVSQEQDWQQIVAAICNALEHDIPVAVFVAELGLEKGVGGYIYHTVPVVLYSWLRHYGDFAATLTAVLDCGGDTDTTGAIAGALAGVTAGEPNIPKAWLSGIAEWPRSVGLLREVARRLAHGQNRPVRYFWPAIILRNLLFLLVVLSHGFLRLIPKGLLKHLIH